MNLLLERLSIEKRNKKNKEKIERIKCHLKQTLNKRLKFGFNGSVWVWTVWLQRDE